MSIEIKISKKRLSYKKAMLYLNKRVDEVKLGRNKELIWILEHPTTFTAGVSYSNKDINRMNRPGQGYFKVLAESGMRAARLCQPYEFPPDKYAYWKKLKLNFKATN